ncbi:hypothetical protein J6TS7_20660 [Paenibacillus dendritiformis]|uniref:hypothetical protein n=1 Tax=Paenibacillus TaxID=44249 RepID=UPI001B11B74E|nr:hypothetical protein [Paenibacillus dendritiformis]GIO78456.1 hypothetical protein J6TS7_20660 [Paenibacillus dendritiformis]
MAWYYGTYSCGHDGRVNVIGKVKDRAWRTEKEFEKVCPDCWVKQQEQRAVEAAEAAAELELPELAGSEKQVNWALVLRQEFIKKFENSIASDRDFKENYWDLDIDKDEVKSVFYYIIETKKQARYYIDKRSTSIWEIIPNEIEGYRNSQRTAVEESLHEEIKAEATVYPVTQKYNSVADIDFSDNVVTVLFEKNEEFREIVKSLDYFWSGGRWKKKIDVTTGPAEDRASELGNKLLLAGFPVRIYDPTVRDNAINGKYEPEHKRWIGKLKGVDRFAIQWTDGTDMYKVARSLPGSRWERPFVTVTVEHFTEVEDFARLYDFHFEPPATRMIEQHKAAMAKSVVAEPIEKKEEPVNA